jgi:LacI family transcriptional regulator
MPQKRRIAVMIDLGKAVVHHQQVFAGIQRYAEEQREWECVIDPHADLRLRSADLRNRLDGVIGRATRRLAEAARQTGVPVVNVWRNTPTRGLPTVVHDARESGRMAGQHLLARGFHNFAFLGYHRDKTSDLQLAGFREAIGRAGPTCQTFSAPVECAESPATWQRFQAGLGRWLSEIHKPAGVFAAHDMLARYFTEGCRQRSLKVPHDLAVISAFNEIAVCSNASPALSSIDYGFDQVGYQAAALLHKLMDGSPPPADAICVPPKALLPRQSSDAFIVQDSQLSRALRFISEHGHEEIDVDDIAEHISTTRRTLARMFQRELGKTIYEALTHMRLERAKRALMEPDAVLKSVAVACGFRDGTHLCRVFQRIEGVTPSEYCAQRGWKKSV